MGNIVQNLRLLSLSSVYLGGGVQNLRLLSVSSVYLGDGVQNLRLLLFCQLSGVFVEHHVLECGLGELGPVVGHLLTDAARLALRLPAQ